jgi:shikimate kinase
VGKYIHAERGVAHLDTDELVEKRLGCTEVAVELFRKVETEVICALPKEPPCVISVGGGALLAEQNRERLRAIGKLVYLYCDKMVLQLRWKAGCLPSFVKDEEAFYRERLMHYESIAADRIDVSALSVEEAANQVLELWKS